MNKTQLIEMMAAKAGITKSDAKKALDAFMDSTVECVKAGDKLALIGFGTFSTTKRAERKGRNPQKPSEIITIPARNVVKFTVGNSFKNAVK